MSLRSLQRFSLPSLVLLGLTVLATQFPAWGSEIKQLAGDRVTVSYPSRVPDGFAAQILRIEESALPYVENFLHVRYQGTVQVYITTGEFLWGKSYAGGGRIYYDYPPWYFQNQQAIPSYAKDPATGIHEMTHSVAFQQLGMVSTLNEGLATAVAWSAGPASPLDPHFLSKGLLEMGQLPPAVQVWTGQLENNVQEILHGDLYNYFESSSFILFLVQEYGIETIKTFYSAIGRGTLSQQDVEQPFHRAYGMDLGTVEGQWHRFLESYGPGQERRAEYLVQAYLLYGDLEYSLLHKLGVYYGLGWLAPIYRAKANVRPGCLVRSFAAFSAGVW